MLAAFKGTESALLFGSGYLANTGVIAALARRGEVVCSDELNHASIIDGCRLAGAETFVYRHADAEHLAWGLRRARQRAALIVTDGVFSMDGDVAPLRELAELAHRHQLPADGRRGARDRRASAPGAAVRSPRPGLERRRGRDRGDARQGARRLWRLRLRLSGAGRLPGERRSAVHLLDRASAPVGRGGLGGARAAGRAAGARRAAAPPTPRRCAASLAAEGLEPIGSETQIVPLVVGEAEAAIALCRAAARAGESSPRRSGRRPCRRAPAACG